MRELPALLFQDTEAQVVFLLNKIWNIILKWHSKIEIIGNC